MVSVFNYDESFTLESGVTLPGYHLAYTTHGNLNATKDNVVWVFHALTGNSNPLEWWPGLVGSDKTFDPKKYFVICVNIPGSCYGSIGPLDIDATTNEPFYHNFPLFTTRDIIRTFQHLKNQLGITKIHTGIGGSLGGQQLLEWAIEEPALFENIIPIATNAFHSPWGIAFNATQRFAIETDTTWKEKNVLAGLNGMKVARAIALISYRTYEIYEQNQANENNEKFFNFKSESYQKYQGEKLAKRFNAFSYWFLSKTMDAHHIGRGRITAKLALKKISAKTLVISMTSDILFPPEEQLFLAKNIKGATYKTIDSIYGHDGFLLEYEKLNELIGEFYKAAHLIGKLV
jgi:homoserine O-acetyltransferase